MRIILVLNMRYYYKNLMSDTLKQKIISAIDNNDFETLDTLMDDGTLPITTCLIKVMTQKNIEGLVHLVEEHDAINIKYNELNIMSIACQLDWLEGVKYLYQFEDLIIDTSQHSRFLYTPLFSSIIYEKPDIMEYLLQYIFDYSLYF